MPAITTPEIEAALAREWRQLREQRALDGVLPALQTRQWILERGRAGYVTVDYRVTCGTSLPGANGTAPGVASLVEHYWSVRTLNGSQDPNWPPSLNLHVVHIRPRAASSADVDSLVRNAMVVKAAARMAGRDGFGESPQASLYVRALLLATEVPGDVALLAGLGTLGSDECGASVDFRAAQFRYSVGEGFVFTALDQDRFSDVGVYRPEEVRAFGEQLLADDLIPSQGWAWRGVNQGPVYDAATGLTVHDGRVL